MRSIIKSYPTLGCRIGPVFYGPVTLLISDAELKFCITPVYQEVQMQLGWTSSHSSGTLIISDDENTGLEIYLWPSVSESTSAVPGKHSVLVSSLH